MQLSILVISRTADLVNRFCSGLNQASSLPAHEAEILCSWNGSREDELHLQNTSRYDFHIAQREPYHFSDNMNKLASKATGDVLMLANDDLKLDPGCIDQALTILEKSRMLDSLALDYAMKKDVWPMQEFNSTTNIPVITHLTNLLIHLKRG